jgi:mannitol-1-phosphate 5-dehydrogenase
VKKTFVGIGFGPLQSGLFLFEAQASGNFERVVVVEVQPEIVDAVRNSQGRVAVNVAHDDRRSSHELHDIEIYNPIDPADFPRIVAAIASADEIATALPSIDFFRRGNPATAQLLARGFERKLADRRLPRAIVYTAENHNHAAEVLTTAVLAELSAADQARLLDHVAFLNTVIGKMSGVVTDAEQLQRDALAPLVARKNYAVLVEEFSRILISQVPLAHFERGITVFQEKPDLLPFEEAKLYGHNAAHALLGYLAHRSGLSFMHEAVAPLQRLVKHAFLKESGSALCRRHAGIDPMFTPEGWTEYVEDLMRRMVSPHLQDRVDRVIRDPRRKLAWNDRLIGTIRLAIEYNIEPSCFTVGAATAAELLFREQPTERISSLLAKLWQADGVSVNASKAIIQRIEIVCHRQHSSLSL